MAGPLIAVVVAGIVAVGVGARFVTKSDLWLDEALSVNIARLPFGDIAGWLKHDGAPPLFYWMLHAWTSVFGTSNVAVRSLAGVAGVIALPLAWCCGRRLGSNRTAWIAVVLVAVNPFAVRFGNETRMYGLEIAMVFGAILAVRRAIERPTAVRLLMVATLSCMLLYTHYWCLSIVGAGCIVLLAIAWNTSGELRRNVLRALGALVVGGMAFAAWLPTLAYQGKHTGTPWAIRQFPTIPIGRSILEFAGGDHAEGWAIVYVVVALLLVGVFGHATSRGSIELDLRNHSSVAPEAALGLIGLALGAGLAYASNSGFQARYSAIALPCVLLVTARGIEVFSSAKVRMLVIGAIVIVGLGAIVRNTTENRTQTGDIARAILARAHAGDVVVYCPDQLGPGTNRVFARTPVGRSLQQVAYPDYLDRPSNVGLVDWVDYVERLKRVPMATAAERVVRRAGEHTIFVVTGTGYLTHDALCPGFVNELAARSRRVSVPIVAPNIETFEHAGAIEFAPR